MQVILSGMHIRFLSCIDSFIYHGSSLAKIYIEHKQIPKRYFNRQCFFSDLGE